MAFDAARDMKIRGITQAITNGFHTAASYARQAANNNGINPENMGYIGDCLE